MSDLISRAEAIEAVENNSYGMGSRASIKAIKALPSAELPKGDLISRADAIARIANDNVVGGMERINEYRDSTEHNDYLDGISTAIATVDDLPSAEAVPIVYCVDCAKSVPLDEHGALWKCQAHDRTTLRHSYCSNGERKGGDPE